MHSMAALIGAVQLGALTIRDWRPQNLKLNARKLWTRTGCEPLMVMACDAVQFGALKMCS